MRRRAFAFLLLAAGLSGCAGKPPASIRPAALPPLPPVRVPEGCEVDLSGRYVHAQSERYRYLGADDGGTLTLTLQRTEAERGDGGDPGVVLELHRTPEGFVGQASAVAVRGTQPCPVTFRTELFACPTEGLALRSAASTSLDERCQPPSAGPPPAMVEQRLLRETPDGGST